MSDHFEIPQPTEQRWACLDDGEIVVRKHPYMPHGAGFISHEGMALAELGVRVRLWQCSLPVDLLATNTDVDDEIVWVLVERRNGSQVPIGFSLARADFESLAAAVRW